SHPIALIQYTSGSTGDPKGVVLSHDNLLANIRAFGEAAQAGPADVVVSWLPLYHDMGLIGAWLGSLYFGCRFVVMAPTRFLARPSRWLWAIHEHGGTVSAAPNFAYELCASKIPESELQGLDLSSWRMALNGAEPVSPDTLRRFAARFVPHGLREHALAPVYGLAECSLALAFTPAGRGPRIERIERGVFMRFGRAQPTAADDVRALEIVGAGHAVSAHELRIVDAQSRELPDREQGEIEFRGPSASRGYADNPAADLQLHDGAWSRTGDLGYIADGELFVTGRSKDVIVRAGHHIHPQEIEAAIGQLPGVRKGCVAAIGPSDARSGTERVVVLVETRETDGVRRRELREQIRKRATDLLEGGPDEVVLVAPHNLPKTTSGKLRRGACRSLYESGAIERGAPSVTRQLLGLARSALQEQLRRASHTLLVWCFSAWAYLCFAALAPVAWLAVMLAWTPRARWWAVHRLARALCVLTGTELTVESDAGSLAQAGVIVANHSSYLDAFALAAALPLPVRFVAKLELRSSWPLHAALDRLGVHYVDRTQLAASLDDARRVTLHAHAGAAPLLFFPEGTFTREPGLRAFHMGAFDTAAKSGLALVPLVVEGTRSMLRDGSWLVRPAALRVRVGPLLRAGGSDFSAALALRDAARSWMLEHGVEPDLDT
ncbi:MAG TPA: AMP-binding protein, partial [Polyangiales bacterium]|nr:AMP-binding protein [Polyangiales bacterium]